MTAEQIVQNIKAGRDHVTVTSACLPALGAMAGELDPVIAQRVKLMGHMVLPYAMAAKLIGYVAAPEPVDSGDDPTDATAGEPSGKIRSERPEVAD